MAKQEALLQKPLGKQFLGYNVPEEFRLVEKTILDQQADGWGHLIDFFIYATYPACCSEKHVQQTLPYIQLIAETETQRQQIWNEPML